jgi:hypothetical protein
VIDDTNAEELEGHGVETWNKDQAESYEKKKPKKNAEDVDPREIVDFLTKGTMSMVSPWPPCLRWKANQSSAKKIDSAI